MPSQRLEENILNVLFLFDKKKIITTNDVRKVTTYTSKVGINNMLKHMMKRNLIERLDIKKQIGKAHNTRFYGPIFVWG